MEPQEPTLDESIKQVMGTLPPVIRDYLAKGKYTEVAKGLITKYNLHIDQGGILEREIMLLLMGIENPTEFIGALTSEAKIEKEVVDEIVKDVNDQIFAPLKEEEMRSDTVAKSQPVRGEIHHPPLVPATNPAVTSDTTPAVAPSLAPVEPVKLLEEEKLLEDHEEPSIVLNATDELKSLGINKIPFPPKKIIPPQEDLPVEVVQPAAPPAPKIPAPPAKPYSVDPYREPIE